MDYLKVFKTNFPFNNMAEEKAKKTKKKVENVKLSEADFTKKVMELSEKGLTSEKIGETLRREGIHPKEHNKKIKKILEEKNAYVNADLKNIENKLEKLRTHFKTNKQDKRAKREVDRISAHVRKAKAYFKVK